MNSKQWTSDPIRRQWKMLHLLGLYSRNKGIHYERLWDAGVDCYNDASDMTVRKKMTSISEDNYYKLTEATANMLELGTFGYKAGKAGDFRVDYPSAFVIMPYREPYESLWKKAVKPAANSSGLECDRADESVRIGDLRDTVWSNILAAGLIVAEVSKENPNVFYELGLATAIGKDVLLLKERGIEPPADIRGALCYEYDLNKWDPIREKLEEEFTKWSLSRKSSYVKALYSG